MKQHIWPMKNIVVYSVIWGLEYFDDKNHFLHILFTFVE